MKSTPEHTDGKVPVLCEGAAGSECGATSGAAEAEYTAGSECTAEPEYTAEPECTTARTHKTKKHGSLLMSVAATLALVTLVTGVTFSLVSPDVALEGEEVFSSGVSRESSFKPPARTDAARETSRHTTPLREDTKPLSEAREGTREEYPEASSEGGQGGESSAQSARAATDSAGGGASAGAGASTPQLTWYPPYDEQVWVDTSSWEVVYEGENIIYTIMPVCSICGPIYGEDPNLHILKCLGSWGDHAVPTGTETVYDYAWVPSGHYETIHHPGYWG